MGAEFFSITPQPAPDPGTRTRRRNGMGPRPRQVHRWMSIVFTLTVVANFAAMTRGPVPAGITYSPLPPLLFLTVTGLYMFARQYGFGRRRPALTPIERLIG
ncbi:hypothetical protein [Sphingomonas profundi]|uniref:hypothetical protein n=1 Tax=Alterirhizorhabdus profundi TaxID=2681549 RepID=UPI0018D0FE7E|nr:hypothetical protein [Sphingomonas profundi]